ncbi:MAG: amidase family protein [Alsobacter sp.]
MDLLTCPAIDLLAALDRREVSSVDLLEATLARIDALNPALNAIVAQRRDLARAAALASDQRRAQGQAGPLEGLPMTIKDAFDVTDMPATTGAPPYRDRIPEEDAAAVRRLRAAGAVILGKSNVSAWCMDFQATNPVYGTSNNPWDLGRTPGGSSGGAAAAVATGMSALELGSDLGGSIRWPAHACGIFGLKPTFGLVSRRGHNPPPPGIPAEGDLSVAGPLARSAADLGLMLDVIMGPPSLEGVRPRLEPPRRERPDGLRVALWCDEPLAPVHPEVAAAVREAAARLAGAGALVDEAARPAASFAEIYETYALLNHAIVAADLPEKVRQRIAASAPDARPGDLDHRSLQARGARLDAAGLAALHARRERLKQAWEVFFETVDVVLAPPAPVPAIPHDHAPDLHARMLDLGANGRAPYLDFLKWSSLATVCHLPAAVVPVRRTAGGLPVGAQVIGPEGGDRSVLAVAAMLETLGCRHVPPPLPA